jgi:two-component system, chemotaxis family, chemotaxis protein CheY
MLDVMVVDDSATIRAAIAMMLHHAGHRVRDAASGEQALELLRAAVPRPDVIIVDLNMPGMDGIELVRRIRKEPRLRFTPVLFLTTESAGGPRRRAKDVGASGWMVKPISAEDLQRVLQRVCTKASCA